MNTCEVHWIKKWAKDFNRHLTREDIRIANKSMKRYPKSFVIRDMHVKTRRYHYTPIIMNKFQNTDKTRCWQAGRRGGVEPSFITGGNAKWNSYFGRQLAVSTKLNIFLPHNPAIRPVI